MSQDDIIRMAREAGFHIHTDPIVGDRWLSQHNENNFHEFAALIAAAEREACAVVCERLWYEWLDSPEENESNKPDAEDCYRTIRARGQD